MRFCNCNFRSLWLCIPFAFMFGCSNGDDKVPTSVCPTVDEAVMNINGEAYSFDVAGTSLNSEESGQLLELDFWVTNPNNGDILRFIRLTIFLNEKGENVIDKFTYRENIDGQIVEADFVEQNFESTVIANNDFCFEATFSGSINVEGIIISIANGKISRVYDDPFNS